MMTNPMTRNDFRTVFTKVIFENSVFFISIAIDSVISTDYGCATIYLVFQDLCPWFIPILPSLTLVFQQQFVPKRETVVYIVDTREQEGKVVREA